MLPLSLISRSFPTIWSSSSLRGIAAKVVVPFRKQAFCSSPKLPTYSTCWHDTECSTPSLTIRYGAPYERTHKMGNGWNLAEGNGGNEQERIERWDASFLRVAVCHGIVKNWLELDVVGWPATAGKPHFVDRSSGLGSFTRRTALAALNITATFHALYEVLRRALMMKYSISVSSSSPSEARKICSSCVDLMLQYRRSGKSV